MQSDKVMLKDVFSVAWRYKYAAAIIMAISLGFSIQLTNWIEKKYKSQFEINVYSKYFQNPLISAIIPGVYNIPEMRFTIDSMVKEAISDDYIDQIAEDFNFYKLDGSEADLARNRQLLRDRFSYYSTGGQSYQVSFTYNDPYVAKKIANTTLDRVKGHFIDSRIETIEMVKQMMLKRLKALSASQRITKKSSSENALASKSPEVLSAELDKIDSDIAALSKQFNQAHPKIKGLQAKRKTIKSWLEEYKSGNYQGDDVAALAMPTDKLVNEQLTSKFYTKYHDFNMALDIEKKSLEGYIGIIKTPQFPTAPIWPKKRLFASVGFILGLVFAFIYIFIKEILTPSRRETMLIEAKALDTMFLGSYTYDKGLDTRSSDNDKSELEDIAQ